MEQARKVVDMVVKASSNRDTLINTFLIGGFVALSIRSANQQREIEALEVEKDSLLNTNKALKKSMWDWKQQLFADASSTDNKSSSLLSLSKLKAIYREAPITQQQGVAAVAVNEDSNLPAPKFVV